jgi:hypothetical protein
MATYVKNRWLLLNDLAERGASGSLSLNIELFLGIMSAEVETKVLELFFGIERITERYILLLMLHHQRIWIEEGHVKSLLLDEILLNERGVVLDWVSTLRTLAQFQGSCVKRRAHHIIIKNLVHRITNAVIIIPLLQNRLAVFTARSNIRHILFLAAAQALTWFFNFMLLRFIHLFINGANFLINLLILRLGLAAVLMIVF